MTQGRRYGTLLIDVETRRPVDILDERSADSFAAWLAARPGTEVICRDRAGVYSNAAKAGSNRENRPARQQAETLPALGPLLESSRTSEPKPPKICRPSQPWHTCDQGRHAIVGITGGSA
jgi:hypothetical protein